MEKKRAKSRLGPVYARVVLAALALVVAGSGAGRAQVPRADALLTAEGVGVIVKRNQARARDQAIVNALRRCVEQVVGDLVDPQLILHNYPLIAADVLDRAEDYIRRYRIFHEEVVSRYHLYRVAVQASVARGALKSDLQAMGLFLERRGKPKVMLLIEEVAAPGGGQLPPGNRSQKIFFEHFRGRGFPVVERPEATDNTASQALAGNPLAAAALGQDAGAQVVLLGKTVVRRIGLATDERLLSYQATISVRAVESDEGRVAVTGSESAVALPGEATEPEVVIREAATKLAAFMADQLLVQWGVEEAEANPIALAITEVSIADLAQFKSSLGSKVAGVRRIIQRRYSAEGALVEVEYEGDAAQLAEALGQVRYGLFTVKVVGVGARRLDLQVLP